MAKKESRAEEQPTTSSGLKPKDRLQVLMTPRMFCGMREAAASVGLSDEQFTTLAAALLVNSIMEKNEFPTRFELPEELAELERDWRHWFRDGGGRSGRVVISDEPSRFRANLPDGARYIIRTASGAARLRSRAEVLRVAFTLLANAIFERNGASEPRLDPRVDPKNRRAAVAHLYWERWLRGEVR